MASTTVSIVVPAATGLLGSVLGAAISGALPELTKRWLNRSEKPEAAPYRRHVIDGRGWAVIVSAVVVTFAAAFAVGTALAWITGAVVTTAIIAWFTWRGWRRMPVLSRESRAWLESRNRREGGWGGLSYRREQPGLIERTYTVQDLSPVVERRPHDRSASGELTLRELLARDGNVLVTGEGGIGKSTNLRQIGSEAARRFWADATRASAPSSAPTPGLFPVLLSARQLVDQPTVEAALAMPSGMLTRAPARGVCWLVLVDAVDEVLDATQRESVWNLLLEAVRAEDSCRYVITSRSVDSNRWRDLGYRDVARYELHPFTDAQLLEFFIRHQSFGSAATDDTKAASRAQVFVDELKARGLIEVVRLPLLAKLAADMYFDNHAGVLPLRRVDLYEHSVAQWLDKFDEVLETQVLRDAPDQERVDVHNLIAGLERRYGTEDAPGSRAVMLRGFLADLAKNCYGEIRTPGELKQGGRGWWAQDLVEVAAQLLCDGRSASEPALRLAVGRVLEATGLIRDPYHDAAFWHQTFADYFIASLGETRTGEPEGWARRLDDPVTHPGAIFTFYHLPAERQSRIIGELIASEEYLRHAETLVVEGICTDSDEEHVVDALWRTRNRNPDTLQELHDEVVWWSRVRALGNHEPMRRRLLDLRQNQNGSISDVANAEVALGHQISVDGGKFVDRTGYDSVGFALSMIERSKTVAVQSPRNVRTLLSEIARTGHDFVDGTLPAIRWLEAISVQHPSSARTLLSEFACAVDSDEFTAVAAAMALARIRAKSGARLLSSWASDVRSSDFRRIESALGLARLGDERGLSLLWQQLRNPDLPRASRRLAADALCQFEDGKGRRILQRIADDTTAPDDARNLVRDVLIETKRHNRKRQGRPPKTQDRR